MRIWSIHPKYLDCKGIVALWRETLLAKSVVGTTKGYSNHSQLVRFKNTVDPQNALNEYLSYVLSEAQSRGYKFNETKVDKVVATTKIPVTSGQVKYEWEHLLKKLAIRDKVLYDKFKDVTSEVHPMFYVIDGPVESWEVI